MKLTIVPNVNRAKNSMYFIILAFSSFVLKLLNLKIYPLPPNPLSYLKGKFYLYIIELQLYYINYIIAYRV
jgi:hypothetical protein